MPSNNENQTGDFPEGNSSGPPSRYFVSPNTIGRWHTGKIYHTYPTKDKLAQEGFSSIARGWLPASPLIDLNTQVLAVGSCFARNFTNWLADHGFNKNFPESPYNALINFNADFESPAAVAQQFRWAFDELDPSSLLWIDKNRHLIAATSEGKKSVRETLEKTEVLIVTLGLSEVWYDRISGEPLWRALTDKTFDADRHVFRVESAEKTLEWLECIERLRAKHLPEQKIIFTLSPIPLKTTFRPISAITANTVSKAILRSAMDEFFRNHENLLNKKIFYYPSYEMVMNSSSNPFEDDNRHLIKSITNNIISYFSQHYCSDALKQGGISNEVSAQFRGSDQLKPAVDSHAKSNLELMTYIAELEHKVGQLQDICDERFLVIEELDKAAKERLELIKKLDARLNE
jgi:hypothetical protein